MGTEAGALRIGPLGNGIDERLRAPNDVLPLWLGSGRLCVP